ncbi:MAG: electron transfer flavoprotein subunit alpha/FixB family protein [Desulfobacteraceae bacterium]|jgi:electron transfer flavoprotein alpha subunit
MTETDMMEDSRIYDKGRSAGMDVWVFAEQNEGRIESVTYELLGEGRKLADELKVKLCAVLLGYGISSGARELVHHGADMVYVADEKELSCFSEEPYAAVLSDLIKKYHPGIFLCGATHVGRSVMARVAVSVGTGLTADCTGLTIDQVTKNLLQTRSAFGGSLMATVVTPDHRPQMVMVRHKVMKAAALNTSHPGDVIFETIAVELLKSRTRRLKYVADSEKTANLSEASIVVAGGRGIQKKENFAMIRDLAEVLGGAIGASRAAVDLNWIQYSHQVGQTGRTVCPRIYIACGISGQFQHLAGMSSSDIIVAINRDPQAPIFKVATYGIVGDLMQLVPMLTAAFRTLLRK